MEISNQKKLYFLSSFVVLITSPSFAFGEETDEKEQGFIKGKPTNYDMCILYCYWRTWYSPACKGASVVLYDQYFTKIGRISFAGIYLILLFAT